MQSICNSQTRIVIQGFNGMPIDALFLCQNDDWKCIFHKKVIGNVISILVSLPRPYYFHLPWER